MNSNGKMEYTDRISLIKNKKGREEKTKTQPMSFQETKSPPVSPFPSNFGSNISLRSVGEPMPETLAMHRSLDPANFQYPPQQLPYQVPTLDYNPYNVAPKDNYSFRSDPRKLANYHPSGFRGYANRFQNHTEGSYNVQAQRPKGKPKSLSGQASPGHKRNVVDNSLFFQMKEVIRENDELVSVNERLQKSLGYINPSFLNKIESMLAEKEKLKNLASKPKPKVPQVTHNISEFLLAENMKLKELIAGYEKEHEYLSSQLSN